MRFLRLVPAICATFIALNLTVLKPTHTSDFTRGAIVGVFIGLAIVSIVKLKRRTS